MRRRDAGLARSVRGRRRLLVAVGAALVSAPLFTVPAAASSMDPRHVTARGFTTSSGAMDRFRRLAAAGHGPVGIILPNSSTAAIVGAALVKGLHTAGLKRSQFEVQNADGSDATQLGDAETDIAQGSRVLLVDPINSGVGTQIEVEAQTKGVKTVDFDNLSLGGSRNYYVGYDQVTAGRLLVKGLASCSEAWHVARPRLLVLPGPANDGTASQLAQGYDAALQPLLDTGGWTVAAQTAGTSDPPTAASEFQAAYAASQGANAALVSSDETDAAVISVLQAAHVQPHTFPTTGIGSTLTGLQNILSGYQCGTVAMPAVPEADAAIALALYLRAGQRPPSGLVNAGVEDTTAAVDVPAVLVTPRWVTASNMASTMLKDGGVTAATLCRGSYAAACRAAGIKP
jgi:D-xylose transport system substrate-binding protein